MSFSERNGIVPAKIIQINSVDTDLRNRLWNEIESAITPSSIYQVWTDFFKKPCDLLYGISNRQEMHMIREKYFAMRWNEVYDLIEFISTNGNGKLHLSASNITNFIKSCNLILEEEVSGYRIINNIVAPITSQSELDEVKEAIDSPMTNISNHLTRALELLSDRNNPDYSNSINESINAVEAYCRKIVKNDNLTLGKALSEMKKSNMLNLHPSMIDAFSKMYGYTSADSGIRHAKRDNGKDISFAEAVYFLVVCSAFVNYLKYMELIAE